MTFTLGHKSNVKVTTSSVKPPYIPFGVSRAFMAGAASPAGDADSPGHLVSPLICRGP